MESESLESVSTNQWFEVRGFNDTLFAGGWSAFGSIQYSHRLKGSAMNILA